MAAATALYDSKRPMPLIFEIKKPKILIIKGNIFVYCKIPIKAEMKTIGNKTLKKNDICPLLTRPPKTKSIPTPACLSK